MQATFDVATDYTVNLYCYDGVNVPVTGGAQAPFSTATFVTDPANNAGCVCVEMPVSMAVPSGCAGIAVEIATTGGRIVGTPATCADGSAASGMLTFITAPACGLATPGTFASLGFILDAPISVSYTHLTLPTIYSV